MMAMQDMLQRAGVQVMLNELSSTVVFERPLEEPFVRKWQLACQGDIAHVVVMPNITLDKLEAFVTDLIASRARHATASIQVRARLEKGRDQLVLVPSHARISCAGVCMCTTAAAYGGSRI